MENQNRASLEDFAFKYRPDFLKQSCGPLQPLSGDAGFRRYFRTNSSLPLIAVDSPPAKESNLEYVQVSGLLESLGVRVPTIFAVDFSSGYFLLEDLGDKLLQKQISVGNADALYQQALHQLIKIQSCKRNPEFVREYDQTLLLSEMQLFPEWFLRKLLGLSLDKDIEQLIQSTFTILLESALAQPKTLVHRDFHSRNLMRLGTAELAVIDFQDAVWGPITYDLVSLSRDCYVRWSDARIDTFVNDYANQLLVEEKISTLAHESFRRWFDLMGLQRHIKVLGIFARLHLRDGKQAYLNDLPLVLRYCIDVMQQYSEFSGIADWMELEVIPACQSQAWYHDWKTAGDDREIL